MSNVIPYSHMQLARSLRTYATTTRVSRNEYLAAFRKGRKDLPRRYHASIAFDHLLGFCKASTAY